MIANLDSELSILDMTFCSPPLAEESSNADPATSLIGSAVKDHSTDPVIHCMSSGEAVSDISLNQSTEMEERPVLESQNQVSQRAEVPRDEAVDDSDAPTNEAVPAADEFSANTLGLKKPSLGHEIQLPALTAPSESAQIDVEKSVEVMPDSPNVGIATRDNSDLRVHVNEVERPESRWTPSYSVSNQAPFSPPVPTQGIELPSSPKSYPAELRNELGCRLPRCRGKGVYSMLTVWESLFSLSVFGLESENVALRNDSVRGADSVVAEVAGCY
ncbi:hypothetical protein F5051DRAFT_446731 [Lentinula edodes]|nr:hypothetical protein F5051DRAFT_446731 [Lentinula edodes]